jgi:hypothetical protein
MRYDSTFSTSYGAVEVQEDSEFRNKFPYFSESAIENKSFQQLKFVLNNSQVHLCYVCSFFYVDLIVFSFFLILH